LDWDAMTSMKMHAPYLPKIQSREDISNYDDYPPEEIDEDLFDDSDGNLYSWCTDF